MLARGSLTCAMHAQVFAAGLSCHGSGGFVAPSAVGGAVHVAGVRVEAGDWVLGDLNGVVVVPVARAADVVAECQRARPIEAACMRDVVAGESLQAAFVRHRGKW
jgi:regulator of RNase E activity RraA